MTLPNIELLYPGQPCTNRRIHEIERRLKRTLPDDYAEFVKSTGGGILSRKNCAFDGTYLPSGETFNSEVEQIFGNGATSNDSDNDLVTYASFLTDEWELPNEVLLIGHTESGMHECFVINYGLVDFPHHSVLHLDSESNEEFVFVADSFSNFLSKLRPAPNYKEVERSPYDGQEGIHAALHGQIGGALAEVLEASSIPDMEQILRRAAIPLAQGNRIGMYITEDAFRFQDLLFYLTQPFVDHFSLDTWKEIVPEGENRYRIAGLFDESFLSTAGYSAVGFYEDSMIAWWKNRSEKGVLVKTPQGYKLKDDYIAWLIDTFK